MKLQGQFPSAQRHKVFLGSYRLRLLFPNGSTGYVGRGSVGLLGHICHFLGGVTGSPLLRIGNFCESAQTSIILDGEHANRQIFNNALDSFPLLREYLRREGEEGWRSEAKGTTIIGNAVLLSLGTTVLSGATIGDGAVIGAQSVVAGNIPDFTIAAGNPASVIRQRLSAAQLEIARELRWWDFDIHYFIQNLKQILDIESNFSELKQNAVYDETPYTVVVNYQKSPEITAPMTISVAGVDIGDKFVPIDAMPAHVSAYFAQMYAPEKDNLTWVPDIFRVE